MVEFGIALLIFGLIIAAVGAFGYVIYQKSKPKPKVLVEVTGGVADVTVLQGDVDVEIRDND